MPRPLKAVIQNRRVRLPLVILALVAGLILVGKNPPSEASDAGKAANVANAASLPPAGSPPGESPPGEDHPGRLTGNTGSPGTRSPAEPASPAATPLAVSPVPPISVEGEAALREMMRQDFAGLEEVVREDGSGSLSLRGRFMHMSAVVVGPDGQPRIECFCSADHLVTNTRQPPPDAPATPAASHPL